MNATTIPEIIDSLQEQKRGLEASRKGLLQQLETVDQSIRRVDGAIVALKGDQAEVPAKRKAGNEKAKPKLPVAGKVEVTKYIEMILHEEHAVDEQALKARVEELAVQDGYYRLGLALRVKQALADARFARSADAVAFNTVGGKLPQAG